MKKKKYKIPIYGGDITLVFFNKDSENDIIEKYGVTDLKYYDAVTLKQNSYKEFVILFYEERLTPGIIAHESKHLLNYIFKYNGLQLDLDNDEAECYFLSWIVNRVHETIRKFDLKIN